MDESAWEELKGKNITIVDKKSGASITLSYENLRSMLDPDYDPIANFFKERDLANPFDIWNFKG